MSENRSPCPVACSLDIFGDRWTLLVIRDLFAGKTSYKEFLQSPEAISTNILSNRLKILVAHGLVSNDETNPKTGKAIYRMTEKGNSIYPVLDAIADWGLDQLQGTEKLVAVG